MQEEILKRLNQPSRKLLQQIKKTVNPREYAQEWKLLMPLVRVDLIEGRSSDYKRVKLNT
jgi:hypothetical protein